jgi:hypothetical protein
MGNRRAALPVSAPGFFPRNKAVGVCWIYHSTASSAHFRNKWIYTATSLQVFMSWAGTILPFRLKNFVPCLPRNSLKHELYLKNPCTWLILMQLKSVHEPQKGLNTKKDRLSKSQFKVNWLMTSLKRSISFVVCTSADSLQKSVIIQRGSKRWTQFRKSVIILQICLCICAILLITTIKCWNEDETHAAQQSPAQFQHFKRPVKSYLPSANIIRRSPYSPR